MHWLVIALVLLRHAILAGLRIGGEKKTFDNHLLVIGDAAGVYDSVLDADRADYKQVLWIP